MEAHFVWGSLLVGAHLWFGLGLKKINQKCNKRSCCIDKVNNIAWHNLINTKNHQMAFQSVGDAVVAFCLGPQRETTMKLVV